MFLKKAFENRLKANFFVTSHKKKIKTNNKNDQIINDWLIGFFSFFCFATVINQWKLIHEKTIFEFRNYLEYVKN